MRTPTPEIRRAFYERLLCALPLGEITESDIAWPNRSFQPDVSRMYLQPWLMYGETATASLSAHGFERLQGVFQITVYGVVNAGEEALEETTARLVDLFRGGTLLPVPGFNRIHVRNAWRNNIRFQEADARPVVVVSANWRQYAQKGE